MRTESRDGSREATRLRVAMMTLADVNPHMPIGEAVKVILGSEQKAAAYEANISDFVVVENYAKDGPMHPISFDPGDIADWMVGKKEVLKYLPEKRINAIKEVRILTSAGLREAKEGVEEYCRRHHM